MAEELPDYDPNNELNFDEDTDHFPDHYDLENEFDALVFPYVKTILNICSEYNIPMMMSFQYKHTGNRSNLSTTTWLPPKRTGNRLDAVSKAILE